VFKGLRWSHRSRHLTPWKERPDQHRPEVIRVLQRIVLRRLVRGLARKQKGRRQEFHSCGGLLSVFFLPPR
jgi:hypothetical protein